MLSSAACCFILQLILVFKDKLGCRLDQLCSVSGAHSQKKRSTVCNLTLCGSEHADRGVYPSTWSSDCYVCVLQYSTIELNWVGWDKNIWKIGCCLQYAVFFCFVTIALDSFLCQHAVSDLVIYIGKSI